MLEALRADLRRCGAQDRRHQDTPLRWQAAIRSVLVNQGTWAVVEFRLRQALLERAGPLGSLLGHLTRKAIEITAGISLHSGASIGPGLHIVHFGTIVVGDEVVIGENCNLAQGVTIGHGGSGTPVLGDCVDVLTGAVAFGPIAIGDHVTIGANAVVRADVPAWSLAVGVPARVIEGRGNALGVPSPVAHRSPERSAP